MGAGGIGLSGLGRGMAGLWSEALPDGVGETSGQFLELWDQLLCSDALGMNTDMERSTRGTGGFRESHGSAPSSFSFSSSF